MKFLPTTKEEMKNLGWDSIDVLLISGDTYLDTSYNGSALVGKWLVEHGFKVGIIAQPEVDVPDDITRLGEPNLFFAVSGGCVDSMVANYTATKKRRQQDDFTPGGVNNKRPYVCCRYSKTSYGKFRNKTNYKTYSWWNRWL